MKESLVMRLLIGFTLAVAAGMAPSQVQAQQVIQFNLELMSEMATLPEEPDRMAFKDNLAEALRKLVARQFPYWDFQYPPSDALPKLTVAISSLGTRTRAESWGANLDMWINDTNDVEHAVGPQLVLFEKGQLQSFIDDGPKRILSEVPRLFRTHLRNAKDKCFEGVINVPLAEGSIDPISPDRFDAFLPLKWERFGRAASSQFRIYATIKDVGDVVIYSTGTGRSYKSTNPPMLGIIVHHNQWRHPGAKTPDDIAKRTTELALIKTGRIMFDKPPEESFAPSNPDAESIPNP
jgi:hypothetical protein